MNQSHKETMYLWEDPKPKEKCKVAQKQISCAPKAISFYDFCDCYCKIFKLNNDTWIIFNIT